MELGLLVDWRKPLFWWRLISTYSQPLTISGIGLAGRPGKSLFWERFISTYSRVLTIRGVGLMVDWTKLVLLVWSGCLNIWRIAKWHCMLIFSYHKVPAHFFQCMQRACYQAGEREEGIAIIHIPWLIFLGFLQ